MYHKDHLTMASLYEKKIVLEHNLPIIIQQDTPAVEVQTELEDDYSSEAVDMAKSELEFLVKASQHILNCLNNGATFQPWMASKITLANDYLNSVAQVVDHEQKENEEENEEDECSCGGMDTPDTLRATGDGTMA